jgi:hypothetical protein
VNSEQWTSLIRTVLSIVLGPASYIVAKGVLTPEQANQLIPAIVPLVMVVGAAAIGKWGIGSHSAPAVAAAVGNDKTVASAVVAAVNSDSVPGVKVVSAASPSPAVTVTDTGAVKTIPETGKV